MTHRPTITLDEATARRVSEEVIRRVVAAKAQERPSPNVMLDALHREGKGLEHNVADAYLNEIKVGRAE